MKNINNGVLLSKEPTMVEKRKKEISILNIFILIFGIIAIAWVMNDGVGMVSGVLVFSKCGVGDYKDYTCKATKINDACELDYLGRVCSDKTRYCCPNNYVDPNKGKSCTYDGKTIISEGSVCRVSGTGGVMATCKNGELKDDTPPKTCSPGTSSDSKTKTPSGGTSDSQTCIQVQNAYSDAKMALSHAKQSVTDATSLGKDDGAFKPKIQEAKGYMKEYSDALTKLKSINEWQKCKVQ